MPSSMILTSGVIVVSVFAGVVSGADRDVPMQTLDPFEVGKRSGDEYGLYPANWVTTPLEPVVIRQNHPEGPSYQEALGYTFRLWGMKRPRLARMQDGTLALLATMWQRVDGSEKPVFMLSHDDGRSWSAPVDAPSHGALVSLGGNELMIYGDTAYFSKDGGKTWDEKVDVPPTADNALWAVQGTIMVEGDVVTVIEAVWGHPPNYPVKSVIHRSHDRGRTWDDRVDVPQWGDARCGEGSIVRAANGDLVAVLRTNPWPGYPNRSDHWCGLATSRSTDDGKTWSELDVHYRYGYHHQELLLLKNGDILMTYAARIGELDGRTYHGVEAVLSHDNGKTWDWANKFILMRWLPSEIIHSPISAQLSDGRIITLAQHDDGSYWGEKSPGPKYIGHVSAVVWSSR